MPSLDKVSSKLRRVIHERGADWIQIRRRLHQFPELGWCEFWTTDQIACYLDALGVSFELGDQIHISEERLGVPAANILAEALQAAMDRGADPTRLAVIQNGLTGAICTIHGSLPGDHQVFRCDIDALPIAESQDPTHKPVREGFSSKNIGRMHACGHDAHIAIGLGLVEVLQAIRDQLHGKVTVIFQPAEEGTRGANSMIETGVVDGARTVFGIHVGVNAKQVGELVCGWRGLFGTQKLDVDFFGRSAHAAIAAEDGRDALAAACRAVVAIKEYAAGLPGHCKAHVGRLIAGEGRNIVSSGARLEMEIRSTDDDRLTRMASELRKLLLQAARQERLDREPTVRLAGFAPAVASDTEAAGQVARAAKSMGFFANVRMHASDYNASDDATLWMRRVQQGGGVGSFIGIGTPTGTGHHTPLFDIDDQVIPPAVELLARCLIS